jgi:murein DD-endopeptidase MepM/ murein hydrolase activator NlpD
MSDASAVYNITGAIDISFDNAPQSCAVKIYDKDILIYEGTEDGLSSLHTDSTERLRVVIDAKWDEREDADSYGNLSYDFLVNIKNRSVFSLSTSSVPRGGFTVLDVSNVIDPSRLKVVSSDESISPQFKWYNGALRAVVYIPKEFESDSLSLDISYGASKDILSIEVFDGPVKDVFLSNYEFSNDSLAAKHFEGIKKAISSNYPSTGESVYFRGNFLNPTDIGYSPLFSDGDTLYFGEDFSYSAVTFGNQYAASFDSSVKALQSGVVAKVAFDDFLGNYVVIDHGCGLVTYYAGLDSIDVSFGDVLLTGQHLGICGKNRMGGYGFSLYCSINGSPVSPNALFEQNIK